ncbi:MAG: hypothetical protein B6244_06155 [Candidatus Cloacimonetes bacterium 4572_55]|nr:MAG: hypothetical protein B6244_06155 [Candidatus Cloacimonetes bacterium 4572_55]
MTQSNDEKKQITQNLVQMLREVPEPLYVILDAARDEKVLQTLYNCEDQFQSLYEGEKGLELAEVAPYLVSLPKGSKYLDPLIELGWGNSWGIFFTCKESFKDARRHLRRFLMVKNEEGKRLYFRYYDPRVLRVFLPTCTPQEITDFFGPISTYIMEAKQPETLLMFTDSGRGVKQNEYPLLHRRRSRGR